MKILFIYPRFIKYLEQHESILKAFLGTLPKDTPNVGKFNAPPALAIPYLAALTPKEHTYEFINDNIEPFNYETDADLVAISFFTPQATRAYEICAELKKRGKIVAVGGIHPSTCPEEAAQHADIVCVGEGEQVWPQILRDVASGSFQKMYRSSTPTDMTSLPLPDRSIYYRQRKSYTWECDILQVSRGCHMPCYHCTIPPQFGKTPRFQTIAKVVDELRASEFQYVYLADDVIYVRDKQYLDYAYALFTAIKEANLGKKIFIGTTPFMEHNPKLFKLMAEAGVYTSYSTVGWDPVSQSALLRGRKLQRQKIVDQVKLTRDNGIIWFGSFLIGLDSHPPHIKDIILEFCAEAKADLAEFFIVCPYPQTPFWQELEPTNRLLHRRWQEFNGASVVFRPKQMTPDQLLSAYLELWAEFPTVGPLVTTLGPRAT